MHTGLDHRSPVIKNLEVRVGVYKIFEIVGIVIVLRFRNLFLVTLLILLEVIPHVLVHLLYGVLAPRVDVEPRSACVGVALKVFVKPGAPHP